MSWTYSARPRVAVLLAAYNGLRWLPVQLASILSQLEVDVTVFASVDRSDDGTEDWLHEQARRDPRIAVLPAGRFGGAAANFFRLLRDVDCAAFDFVSLADQDDLWLPDKLSRAVGRLAREQAAGYSANVIAFWNDGRTQVVNKAQAQTVLDFVFEAAGPGCTYVLAHDLAAALKTFVSDHAPEVNQVYLHDWFIYAFARSRGYRWTIDPAPCLHYRQHATNQVGVNTGLQALLRRARMAIDGSAFAQAEMIARLVGADRLPQIASGLAGGRIGLLRLALRARQCRRRPRDQVYFFFACLVYALNPNALRGRRSEK
ncbi:MAG: glycosyltransferase [Burkholderiaceae bacterium]|nr:glycosyltransferase [Burkholderiaceae bacterium]